MSSSWKQNCQGNNQVDVYGLWVLNVGRRAGVSLMLDFFFLAGGLFKSREIEEREVEENHI